MTLVQSWKYCLGTLRTKLISQLRTPYPNINIVKIMINFNEDCVDYRNPLIIAEVMSNKQKILMESLNKKFPKINFKRLIFFEKAEYMDITTFEDKDIQIDFIPSDTCQYSIKNICKIIFSL